MKNILLLFSIVFFLFSCEKNDPADPENINDQDYMLKSAKPAQPGDNLKVIRYEGGNYYMYMFYDLETDLTAFVGVDIRQLYSGGGLASFDVLNIQSIEKEGDEGEMSRLHVFMSQDDIKVEVWKGLITYPGQLFSTDPVYSGTGHAVYTDNDYQSEFNNNKYTNVWGLRVNGAGINIKYHAMWKDNDLSTIQRSTSIMLN